MKTPTKRCELDKVLKLLVLGKTKAQIREKLGLKPSALANHLRRLENLGCIERKGKYVINVLRSSHLNPKVTKNQLHNKLNKRGHAFNFKVIFPKETDLREKEEVINQYNKGKLEKLSFKSYKLSKDNNTIWINKGSLTIYSNNSYYSDDALHTAFRSLKDIDNLIRELKQKFGFTGIYGIEVFREHYGLIFNEFAKWLLSKGRKMYVKNEKNKSIIWVDDSRKDDKNLKEFEVKDALKANSSSTFFDSHDKTNWENDAHVVEDNKKEIANLKGVFPAMQEYNENLKLHIKVQKEQLETQKQMQNLLLKLDNKL